MKTISFDVSETAVETNDENENDDENDNEPRRFERGYAA